MQLQLLFPLLKSLFNAVTSKVPFVFITPLINQSCPAEPPVFVKRLEASIVWMQGATARLQGTVKGSPELHTSWFFNNSELSTGGRYEISLKDGSATLEIQDVMLSDSGNYTCEVLNESGCESCSTKVTVKGVWAALDENQTLFRMNSGLT